MNIGESKEYFGKLYTAVAYQGTPKGCATLQEDEQCNACGVDQYYCGLKDECHNEECPFVMIKTQFLGL